MLVTGEAFAFHARYDVVVPRSAKKHTVASIVSLTGATLVAACSFDWTIGSGSVDGTGTSSSGATTSGGTSGTPTNEGGASSGNNAEGGTTNPPAGSKECGINCECKNRDVCTFTCTTGTCNLKCSENATCNFICGPGVTCALSCEDDATCNFDCSAGRATCAYADCKNDATCTGVCKLASICTRDCDRDCKFDCSGGGFCP